VAVKTIPAAISHTDEVDNQPPVLENSNKQAPALSLVSQTPRSRTEIISAGEALGINIRSIVVPKSHMVQARCEPRNWGVVEGFGLIAEAGPLGEKVYRVKWFNKLEMTVHSADELVVIYKAVPYIELEARMREGISSNQYY